MCCDGDRDSVFHDVVGAVGHVLVRKVSVRVFFILELPDHTRSVGCAAQDGTAEPPKGGTTQDKSDQARSTSTCLQRTRSERAAARMPRTLPGPGIMQAEERSGYRPPLGREAGCQAARETHRCHETGTRERSGGVGGKRPGNDRGAGPPQSKAE